MPELDALDDLLGRLTDRIRALEARLDELGLLQQGDTSLVAAHPLVGAPHTVSGLTQHQPLRATGAAAYGFGALDLAQSAATTGTLPPARGGTGASSTPSNGQVPIGNGSLYVPATLTGTSNQINVSNGAGSITLSTPQNIHTGAGPTFASLTLTSLTSGRVPVVGGGGALGDDADLTFNGTQLALATTGSGGGVLIGGDTQLYRSAADILRTPDLFAADNGVRPGTIDNIVITARQLSIAASGTAQCCSVAKPHAWLFINDSGASSGSMAIYAVRGGSNTSHEIFDVGGFWGTSAGASTFNLYRDATPDAYVIQNTTGSTRTFNILEIRVNP